jgi:hypothetical protein
MTPDPLTAECPDCLAAPGKRCMTLSGPARKTHAARKKHALILAAHSDASLAAIFGLSNQCQLCGVPGLPQRHRVVDAIAGQLEAGECETDIMAELGVSLDAVMAVTAWASRWPGAWR